MRSLKLSVIIILCIGVGLCLIPIAFYISHFGKTDLSNNPQNWGVFGDYVGGTLNPVLSCINLALLIAISIYVAKMDTNRQINEFRYKAYTDLRVKIETTVHESESLESLNEYLLRFATTNQFLFTGETNRAFNNAVQQLRTAILTFVPFMEEFEEGLATGKNQIIEISKADQRRLGAVFENAPPMATPETEATEAYESAKMGLIAFMQVALIDGDIRPFLPQ